jgi:hypothetical protein
MNYFIDDYMYMITNIYLMAKEVHGMTLRLLQEILHYSCIILYGERQNM